MTLTDVSMNDGLLVNFERLVAEVNLEVDRAAELADPARTWMPSLIEKATALHIPPFLVVPRLPSFRASILQNGGPLRYPDCHHPGSASWYNTRPFLHPLFARYSLSKLKRSYHAVARALGVEWQDCPEDMIGTPFHSRTLLFVGRRETEASLANSLYYSLVRRELNLQEVSSLIEIGGGFGGLTGRIMQRHPHLTGYFSDLPRNTLLAAYYLSKKLGSDRTTFITSSSSAGLPGAGQVGVVWPWALDTLNARVDVAVNTFSFQHMNAANHDYYFGALRRLGVRKIFSMNREDPLHPGESPVLAGAEKHGYRVSRRLPLKPWLDEHYVHIFQAHRPAGDSSPQGGATR